MAPRKQFVHLHSHTEFSKLDGMSKVDELVAKVAEDGGPAATSTDHGNMAGSIQLVKSCKNHGIKPIIGIEAYLARDIKERERNTEDGKGIFHQLLLARNLDGYHNLMKMTSLAYRDGKYVKPRIDVEMLSRHSKGVIGTTTCLGSLVNQELLKGNRDQALKIAADFRDVLDPGNYFVEVQNHGIPDQLKILGDQVWLSKQLGVPLVATNDNHYTDACDAEAHDTLLCINSGSRKSDIARFKFESDQHYIKTADEMYDLFPEADFPGACSNTLKIADMVELDLDISGQNHLLPKFPLPDKWDTAESMLRDLVIKGGRRIYDDLPDRVMDRIEHELNVIEDMGFSDYFLILSDVVQYMRSQGCLIGPGRGSAAGSIVAYCLGITSVDPLEHGLYFERFLNPGRRSMPDIDVDFDPDYRDMAFDYVADKYGHDCVAFIGTYGTMKGRGSLRDVSRVMGHHAGATLASKYPPSVADLPMPLMMKESSKDLDDTGKRFWRDGAEFRKLYIDAKKSGDTDIVDIIDSAVSVSGTIRNEGVHPAGILITPGRAMDHVPLRESKKSDTIMTSQYNMVDVELTGALKYDFLGLLNLTTIKRAMEMIDRDMGRSVDVMSLPLDDPKVYQLLRAGDLDGLFQVTSPGMMDLIGRMQPTDFEDISAAIALYRPGPMAMNVHYDYADRKNGRQKVTGIHPDFLEITKNTYGLVVYQETVMQLAQHFAGYDAVDADNFRKAMGKKKASVMEAEHEKFIDGVKKEGFPAEIGQKLWDIIEPFSGYAFNKSHSVAYGKITYITAWLKSHYPAQFYAASIDCMGSDKSPGFVAAAKRHGINVYAPDINRSGWYCTTSKDSIWLGMGGIASCGKAVIDGIERERHLNGEFGSIGDFLTRVVESVKINKTSATNLIHASVFDTLHPSRKALADNIEYMLADAKNIARHTDDDDDGDALFDLDEDIGTSLDDYDLSAPDYPSTEKSALELQSIGFFVSGHPFDQISPSIPAAKLNGVIPDQAVTPDDSSVVADAKGVTVFGILTSVETRRSKNKKEFTKFVVEAGYGASIQCIIFGRAIDKSKIGSVAVVKGNIKLSYDAISREESGEDDQGENGTSDLEMTCDDISLVRAERLTSAKPVRAVTQRKPEPEPSEGEVVDLQQVRSRKRQAQQEPAQDSDKVYQVLTITLDDLSDADFIRSILTSEGSTEVRIRYRGEVLKLPNPNGGGFKVTDSEISELESLTDIQYEVI